MATLDLFRNAENARSFNEGDIVFSAGDVGEEMFVVLDGSCEILIGDRIAATLGPGEIVGEMALIDDQHVRSAHVRAGTPLTLAPIDRRQFEFMLRNHPHFAVDVMKTMVERLHKMNALHAS